MTFNSKIETAYYNVDGRGFKTPDICIHCAAEGSTDFLFRQDQLEEQGKTKGKKCYPVCKICLEAGEQVATYKKAKTKQSQKRIEDSVRKSNESNKRRKKS